MDTALNNGDFLLTSNGHPVQICDIEELLQRALIRLCVKKGSFIYDRNLGSELYKLRAYYSDGNTLREMAKRKVVEAIKPIEQLSVENVTISQSGGSDRLLLNIDLKADDKFANLEVKI